MKNCVKQMLRTPVQSAFMMILIMSVTAMLALGGNLWMTSHRLAKDYEDDFITIGTVAQKPDTMRERNVWDAEKGDYLLYKDAVYHRYVTEEDLDFPEAVYLTKPEKRVYWGSYTPEYLHAPKMNAYRIDDMGFVAEFSPLEDCVPNESVKIRITKVLGSSKTEEGNILWFCDHYNEEPYELKADKTYIARIYAAEYRHGKRWEEMGSEYPELGYACSPENLTLYTPDGSRIDDPLEVRSIYEVSEGFYNTDIGKRFLALADMSVSMYDTQPVVGTNSTDLLMPFYERNAWVYEGRYPTAEEYENGSAVCLAPGVFAENNGLSVGDQVTTRLYFTDARRGPEHLPSFSFSIVGLDGKLLEPFEEKAYTIVGLYDYKPGAEGIGADELIVPLESVHNQMENIVDYGAMADFNTSFRIENGRIADFLEISAEHGADNLTFTFYDRGYSALMEGIRNLKNMSVTLLAMGLIAAVILTLQISHIYVTKQKRRLSIERLMGMTGKRCRQVSLLGILLLLLLGTVPGAAAGTALAGKISVGDAGQGNKDAGKEADPGQTETGSGSEAAAGQTADTEKTFSRKYSNLGLSVENEIDFSGRNRGDPAVSCAMGALVLSLGFGFSDIRMRKLLRGEPLHLLEESAEEKRCRRSL